MGTLSHSLPQYSGHMLCVQNNGETLYCPTQMLLVFLTPYG